MRIPKVAWILALWLLIVVLFFSFQTWLDSTSKEIWVKPVPVDPRDIFRGEYVQLRYDFSVFYANLLHQNEVKPKKVSDIYAVLIEKNGLYVLSYFTLQKPSSDLVFLKGTLIGRYSEDSLFEGATIRYNIESWFVPEGQGPELEKNIGGKLKAKLRINPWGWARIV